VKSQTHRGSPSHKKWKKGSEGWESTQTMVKVIRRNVTSTEALEGSYESFGDRESRPLKMWCKRIEEKKEHGKPALIARRTRCKKIKRKLVSKTRHASKKQHDSSFEVDERFNYSGQHTKKPQKKEGTGGKHNTQTQQDSKLSRG